MLCTHGMMVFVKQQSIIKNIYYYTAAQSTRVRNNSQLDATTEQNADLDPELLELRQTLAGTI